MSQVSKRKVSTNVEQQMYETLWTAMSKIKSTKDIQIFLNDLLSPIEKTMIAKRLAIAALLSRNYDYQSIMDILKVSSTTISKVSLSLNYNNGYKTAINKISRSEATRTFWRNIESLTYRFSSPGKVFLDEETIKHKLHHKRKTLVQ